MNQRELFDVIVRTIGLLVVLRGLWWSNYAIMAAIRQTPRPPDDPTWKDYLVPGVAYSIFGGLLMAYAEGIARLVYR